MRNAANRFLNLLLAAVGSLYVLLPASPLNVSLAGRDSGVFLYAGWRILGGELPYRDIWDHKPPIVFYINALGLAITDHSRWGVWAIEFAGLFLAALIGFRLIQRALGTLPAVLSSSLWLLTLGFVIQGGNFTTEYTLPLQFAALWLVLDVDRADLSDSRWMLIGLLGALAFFTKQTTIGIWIAIALYLTLRHLKSGRTGRWIRELSFVVLGGLALVLVCVSYFGSQGALPQFWDAAFRFNFSYSLSTTGLASRLDPITSGLTPLTHTGLLQFSMLGYVAGLLLIRYRRSVVGEWMPLLAIGLIDLPVELILISASGRTYSHYYMTLLPVLALFAGLMFRVLLSALSSRGITGTTTKILTASIVGVLVWSSFAQYAKLTRTFRNQVSAKRQTDVVDFVRSRTESGDYVLLWGAESSVNYFAQRRSPSRFVYQYPLYAQGYVDEPMILEFLDDVVRNRPRLIIDTRNAFTPIYDFPIQTEAIQARVAYLKSHYRFVKDLGVWPAYEFVAGEGSP